MYTPFISFFLFCFLLLKVAIPSFSQNDIDSIHKIVNSELSVKRSASLLNISKEYNAKGDYTKALYYAQEVLNSLPSESDDEFKASLFNHLGMIYSNKLEIDKSLKYYLKSLKFYEKLKDTKSESAVQLNIGEVYRKMRNYNKAIECFNSSLKRGILNKDSIIMANSAASLGAVYYDLNDLDSSIFYFKSAKSYYELTNDITNVALTQNNMGSIYNEIEKYPEAIANYKEAMSVFSKFNDSVNYAMCMANIGNVYNNMKDYKQGIIYSLKGLEISSRLKDINNVASCYIFLAEGYQLSGDYQHALEFQTKLLNLKDTIYDLQTNQNIAEMQTRYDTEKKENENKLLKQENDIQNLTINKQKIITYSISFGLILVLMLVFYIYRGYQQKQRANLQLEEKNILIEEKNKNITDSINYAKRIQEAVLPVSVTSRAILGEHFILFKPKDIVSGDFYWITKIKNFLIVAVADCTGHGVPGAFMSMLGISYLNEIVQKQEVVKASHVLNRLRKEIINALQQKGVQGEQKDGMDISLLVVNEETKECQWAGANNPLYIIYKGEESKAKTDNSLNKNKREKIIFSESTNYKLEEIKGDNMPIAIHVLMNEFSNHTFNVEKGNCLYLSTDGFADQFGGPKGRKYMYKKFKEVLLQSHGKSMNEQKEILESSFENWRGKYDQIDDVTVIGIRI